MFKYFVCGYLLGLGIIASIVLLLLAFTPWYVYLPVFTLWLCALVYRNRRVDVALAEFNDWVNRA